MAIGLLAFAALAPAEADESFTPGSGASNSTSFVVNIPYSGANIGLGIGEASTTYFENNATAQAQTVNPGFLNLAKILKTCGVSYPIPLPEPTTANTKRTGGEAETNEKSAPKGGFGGGSEYASATPGSAGYAKSGGLTMGIPGIVRIDGGDAVSESKVDPATQVRTEIADVNIGTLTLLKGLVVIEGLHWRIEHVVAGPDDRSHTIDKVVAFSMGTATLKVEVLGLPIKEQKFPAGTPPADVISAINTTLAPFGLTLLLPEEVPNGEHGVEITPFTVRIGGNAAYGKLLYPFLAGTNDLSVLSLFNKLGGTLFDPQDCEQLGGLMKFSPELNAMYNSLGVIAPILINAFAAAINGGASIDVSLGGVRTTIDDTYYPPREVPVAPPRSNAPPQVASSGGSAGTPGRPATPATPGSPGQPVASAIAPVSTTGPTTCSTTSPVGSPGCWKGAGPLAATFAGVVTLGLLVGDEIYRRRRVAAAAAVARQAVPI